MIGTNTSNWTSAQLFTTLTPVTPCNTPGGLSSVVSGTSVSLNWNQVSNAVKYDLRRRVQGTTNWLYVYNIVSTNIGL